jgi:hypothetical protein
MSQFGFDKILQDWNTQKDKMAEELIYASKDYFVKSFESQSWDGNRWVDLKETTKKQKANEVGFVYPILFREGDLKEALHKSVTGKTFNDCELTVQDENASYHNNGEGRQPKRQFVGQTNDLSRIQVDIIEKNINKVLK